METSKTDIAVIGMAGRFPEAANIGDFFQNLKNGRDSLRPLSRERKRDTSINQDMDYTIFGYMEHIDLFDHDFFKISMSEATRMDPRQRLMLEVVYETIENAGYNADLFNGTDTCVFVGDTSLDYYRHINEFDPTVVTGNMNPAVAGRIARYFNLRGTAEMTDTACSSSLVALYHACNELILGNADYAFCCGCNLVLFPTPVNNSIQWDIISPDGKVKAFSADANGTVPGEAVVCVLLKPLSKAIADNDIIHGVIKAVAVNQDGNLSASLTAPDSRAQAEVIRKAWTRAGIDPRTITYVESHGTGTKLGDPIEIDGLNMAFKEFTTDRHFCAVSSVKTNIGHTDSAAGIAGLVKALLSLKHQVHFPSLHFTKPNPFIDFEDSAVYVNTGFKKWELPAGQKRRAGISSFGLIGTNCHMVLEEAPVQAIRPAAADQSYLFTFSAESMKSLEANLRAIKLYLTESTAPLQDISYTLTAGRRHHRYRCGIISNRHTDLLEQLSGLITSGNTPAAARQFDLTIFCFSDTRGIERDTITDFSSAFPVFNTACRQCDAYIASADQSAECRTFIFQYCFYRLLESKGVSNKMLMGDGIGKLVIAVIKGDQSLGDAMAKAALFSGTDNNEDELLNRIRKMLDKEGTKKNILFAEMGPVGNISHLLTTLKSERENLEVVCLNSNSGDSFLQYVQHLYTAGYSVKWDDLFAEVNCRRTELPAYQFLPKRCWTKEQENTNPEEWLYTQQWVPSAIKETGGAKKEGALLVFADSGHLSEHVIQKLIQQGHQCIIITEGNAFRELVAGKEYEINCGDEQSYKRLDTALTSQGIKIAGILDLGNFRKPVPLTAENMQGQIEDIVYRQLWLLQTFSRYFTGKNFRLLVVNAHAQKIAGDTSLLMPVHAIGDGMIKAIVSEYPSLKIACIDLAYDELNMPEAADNIYRELFAETYPVFAGYRQGVRYVQQLTPVQPAGDDKLPEFPLHGTYLLAGGTGRIGAGICRSLAEKNPCTLVILGRKELPAREVWEEYIIETGDTDTSLLLREFMEISQLGATIDYYAVDIADPAAVDQVFSVLQKKYSRFTGVIQAAGNGMKGLPLQSWDSASFLKAIDAKVKGTILLTTKCSDFKPGYFILFSSLNAIVPKRYSVEYAAANAFLDAYVNYAAAGTKFIAINWPGWLEKNRTAADEADVINTNGLQMMPFNDGLKIIDKLIVRGLRNVVVANADLKSFTVNPFFLVHNRPDIATSGAIAMAENSKQDTGADTESKVLAIWYEVLESEHIGPDDDFFELGGHSLNGTQVINKLEKAFGIELDFEIIFDYSTVRTLAALIDSMTGSIATDSYTGITAVAEQVYYPLSYGQKSLWLFDQVQEQKEVYIMPGAFHLYGKVDVQVMERVFAELVKRHESLRTVFQIDEGEPRQLILKAISSAAFFRFIDLQHDDSNQEIARLEMEKNQTRPFDLATGPLLRITLIRLEAEKFLLLFAMHHIIADDWSLDVLMNDMLNLYHAFNNGETNPLVPLHVQYKDFVQWQQQQLTGQHLGEHRSFWLKKLEGNLSGLSIPPDTMQLNKQTFAGKTLHETLDPATAAALHKMSADNQCTLFITLMTIFKLGLYRYTNQEDILIGTPVAGRNHDDLNNQVGFYINTVLVRTKLDSAMSFSELLSSVREYLLSVYKHDGYPLDLVLQDLAENGNTETASLIHTGFTWIKGIAVNSGGERQQDFQMEWVVQENKTAKYDMWLYGYEDDKSIYLDLEFNTGLFKETTAANFLSGIRKIAEQVISNPGILLGDIHFSGSGYITAEDERGSSIKEQFNFNF
jgi:acyl transferase domain-containing protein/acyl carrier protein